ncbi:MAG TPA: CD225/dispanin family protein [Candidatus Mediterraneibacter colneyensis]|nr:CD225/dispanin family protein [Candidatus Mediterraneibacter colneyensis]
MNCIKCYQEIPDGSKFCPHCGAQQPDTAGADQVNVQAETAAPSEPAAPQAEPTAPQAESQIYTAPQTQYQDAQSQYTGAGYQDASNTGYQNNQYQGVPTYQSNNAPEKQINWVPYLVLSIISTVCCCLPFGIVAIVYSAKINSAMSAGDYAAAEKASKTARIWIIVAFIVGIVATVLLTIFYGGLLGSIGSGYYYYNY